MKKKEVKEVSEEEFSNEDAEENVEEEANSGDDWTPNNETGTGGRRGRPRRSTAGKKRQHSDEEEEEEEEEEDEEEDESDSGNERKSKRKRQSRKGDDDEEEEEEDEEDEEEDSDDNFNDTSGIPAKDFTSGAFVVAKSDAENNKDPVLWRIDGKALLQKYLPFEEEGKTLYKSTSTYSGWSVNNKDKYYAAKINFKVQSKQETVVELHLDETKKGQEVEVKDEKEE